MMEQESKQIQQSQDNTRKWSELKVREMAELMQHHMMAPDSNGKWFPDAEWPGVDGYSNLHPEWAYLREGMADNDTRMGNNGERKLGDRLNGFVDGLFAYFFAFIAAMNEKEKENGINLRAINAVDKLAETYNLDAFCFRSTLKYSSSKLVRYTFEYNIAQMIPFKALPTEYAGKTNEEKAKVQKSMCWNRILGYLADGNAPTCQNELGYVFDWLYGKNADASKATAEKIMDSYGTCQDILNKWWEYLEKNKNNEKSLLSFLPKESLVMQQAEEVQETVGDPVKTEPENDLPAEEVSDPLEGNEYAKEARDRIKQGVKQIIFTGAPGTGKTYAATLIASDMGNTLPGYPEPYKLVQFHPSYDYTDFVEGLRPVEGEDKKPAFVKLDGQFKAFCRKVAEENKKSGGSGYYFFIIDEINRADLSKVFGELMFCLESDKRGKKVDTQYQNLPTYILTEEGTPEKLARGEDVFAGGFYVPENVYIIGTMNDIDRSVESMDFALRRRFEWKEAVVELKMLEEALPRVLGKEYDGIVEQLAKSIDNLNEIIESEGKRYGLTRQHFISQGQFANLPKQQKNETVKAYVWKYRLEPLLREYLRGEAEKDIDGFIDKCKAAFGGIESKKNEQ